ncbi:MAG: flagellar basal body P-ring formation protein FlgA [Cyanobacteria bacterium REEB65]|nr:flagellar basal body P-ring formation protein FlgA [Cyanobacteria bacterium REEB65]
MTRGRATAAAIAIALSLFALQRPAMALTEGTIVDFVREQAAQRYQVGLKNVTVQWKGPALGMIAPHLPDDATLKLGSAFTLSGTMPVPLQVWQKGKQVAMIFPELDIDVWEGVLVTTTSISRGSPISKIEIRRERRTLASLGSEAFTSQDALDGAVAMRDLPPGTVLTPAVVNIPPLVLSGSMVNVRLISGGLTILTTGQALQDGRKSQVVRILNPASQRDYMGVVVGKDLVDVQLEGGDSP